MEFIKWLLILCFASPIGYYYLEMSIEKNKKNPISTNIFMFKAVMDILGIAILIVAIFRDNEIRVQAVSMLVINTLIYRYVYIYLKDKMELAGEKNIKCIIKEFSLGKEEENIENLNLEEEIFDYESLSLVDVEEDNYATIKSIIKKYIDSKQEIVVEYYENDSQIFPKTLFLFPLNIIETKSGVFCNTLNKETDKIKKVNLKRIETLRKSRRESNKKNQYSKEFLKKEKEIIETLNYCQNNDVKVTIKYEELKKIKGEKTRVRKIEKSLYGYFHNYKEWFFEKEGIDYITIYDVHLREKISIPYGSIILARKDEVDDEYE